MRQEQADRAQANDRADAPEEEGGDGYFASVSDMMVGILFVFLLMLTVFALNYREAEQRQEVSRAELEEAKEEAQLQTIRADRLRAWAARPRCHHRLRMLVGSVCDPSGVPQPERR